MIGEWKGILVARAADWDLPPRGDWKCLLHNNYHPAASTLNVLWFHGKDRFPRAVTKIGRQESTLVHEFESLRMVYPLAESYMPRPLCLEKRDELWMLWMAGVPGFRIPRRSSYPAPVLQSMVDMLASIHHGLARPAGESSADRHERMVARPLTALMEWGPSAEVRASCRTIEGASSAAWLQQLPVIPQHGDVFLDNVIRDRDRYYLVDWETFGAIDLPFYDLLTLMISILRASGETPERLNSNLVRQVPLMIEQYARRLGLAVSLVPKLLPLTMANWFYLHWLEGRQPIMEAMYATIDRYFRHKGTWDEVFVQT
jgi:aminoglycoside phosphotransferase (APT) family kinase protein